MINIDETSYGYKVTFEGFAQRDDVEKLSQRLGQILSNRNSAFSMIVDLRASRAIPAEAQEQLMQGINYCTQYGMERCAVVVSSAIAKIQAVRIAKETGIYDTTRYVDASTSPDWEKEALGWIRDAKDPES